MRRMRSFQTIVIGIFLPLIVLFVALTGFLSFHLFAFAQEKTLAETAQSLLHLSSGYFDARSQSIISMMFSLRDSQELADCNRDGDVIQPMHVVAMQAVVDEAFAKTYDEVESISILFRHAPAFSIHQGFHRYGDGEGDWKHVEDWPLSQLNWEPIGSIQLNDGRAGGIVGIRLPDCAIIVRLSERFLEESFAHLFAIGNGLVSVESFCFNQSLHAAKLPQSVLLYLAHSGEQGFSVVGSYLLVYDTLHLTGWKVAMAFALDEVFPTLHNMRNLTLLVLLLIVLVGALAALLSTRWISRPLARFAKEISTIDVQHLEHVQVEISHATKELELVSSSVSNLLKRTKVMMQEQREQEQRESAMQNRLLLAQINPHFLYNTLYAIAQECEMGESKEAVAMLNELALFFRLGLNSGRDIVALRDEVAHAKAYVCLMARSLSQKLVTQLLIPEELMDASIPKMTLQPIVENSIRHGIREKEYEEAHLTVTAQRRGSDLLLVIEDDGAGMTKAELEKLRLSIAVGNMSESFGMQNVHQRIRSLFGSNYGIQVDSKEGFGTLVTITLPFVPAERSVS